MIPFESLLIFPLEIIGATMKDWHSIKAVFNSHKEIISMLSN